MNVVALRGPDDLPGAGGPALEDADAVLVRRGHRQRRLPVRRRRRPRAADHERRELVLVVARVDDVVLVVRARGCPVAVVVAEDHRALLLRAELPRVQPRALVVHDAVAVGVEVHVQRGLHGGRRVLARRAVGDPVVEAAAEGVLGLREEPRLGGEPPAPAGVAVRPEALAAPRDALGCARARPAVRLHAAPLPEDQHHDAPVRRVLAVALALVGGAIEPGLVALGEHQHRVELAAALEVALAAGVGAAREEVLLLVERPEVRRARSSPCSR